jgi:hypothetical protein
VPGACHYTPKWILDSRLCYSGSARRLLSPQSRKPRTHHYHWQQESPCSLSQSKNTRFLTEGRKAITHYSSGGTRSPVPPKYMEAQHFILHLHEGQSHLSCPRMESQLLHWVAICYSAYARKPASPQCTETQHSLLWLKESSCVPTIYQELQPSYWKTR